MIYNVAICDSDKIFQEYIKQKEIETGLCQEELINRLEHEQDNKGRPLILGYYRQNHVQLLPEDIMYISIAKHGSILHPYPGTVHFPYNGKIFCKRKVRELYEFLKDFDFAYAHNSYIVNMKYIKSRSKEEIQLMNGEILTVSRSKTKELKERMNLFFEQNTINGET